MSGRRRPRAVGGSDPQLWWTLRPAQSRKAATYRCPLCDELLHAMSAHTLMLPYGQAPGRRHAHTACVLRARQDGRVKLREDVVGVSESWWRRLGRVVATRGRTPG